MPTTTISSRQIVHKIADKASDELVDALATVLTRGLDQAQLSAVLREAREMVAAPPDTEAAEDGPEAQGLLADPIALARQRGLAKRRELLEAEGGPLTGAAVGSLLGLSRQAVDKRRRVGRLIGVSLGRRGYAYPSWQFDQEGVLPGLEAVLDDLQRHDAWMKIVFLLTPNAQLDGETPLTALRRGQLDRVRLMAQAFGEHGAA